MELDFGLATSAVNWNDALWSSDITGASGWKIFGVTGSIAGLQNVQIVTSNWLDGADLAFDTARPDASFSLFQGGDGVYLNYSAVPEASSCLLISIAGCLTVFRRKRRNA